MIYAGVGFAPAITPLAESQDSVASAALPRPSFPRETRSVADPQELLVANLALVERAVAFVSRRYRLAPDEQEEFGAIVRLRLVENEYAIIRKFEGRSSFAAYITVVVQRLLLDHRVHQWGKWHPSAEARRLGEVAIEVEKLIRRDGRTVDEAMPVLQQRHGSLTREEVQRIADRLPERAPKKRIVPLEEADAVGVESAPVLSSEHERLSERLSSAVRDFLSKLEPEDRLALQLRFDGGMSVADISRSLRLDQKKLYRRMEAHLRDLRRALESQGIAAEEAADLIGDRGVVLDFRLDEVRT